MKVYRKIILDQNNKVLYEDSYDYEGTGLILEYILIIKVLVVQKPWKKKPRERKISRKESEKTSKIWRQKRRGKYKQN